MSKAEHARKTTFSVMSSSLLHMGLAVAIMTLNIQIPKPTFEVIEIQVGDRPASVESPVTAEPKALIETPKTPEAPANAAPVVKAALPAKEVPSLETSDIEQSLAAPVAMNEAADFDGDSIANDLDEADEATQEALAAKVASAMADAEAHTDDSDVLAAEAKKAEQDSAAESAAKMSALRKMQAATELAKLQEARQKADEEARAVALAKQKEEQQARAEAQAQEAADAEARYKAAQQAAQLAAKQAAEADREQEAAAQAAAAAAAAEAQQALAPKSGTGSESVRTLDDLKQMPGNKRPMYENADRLAGRNGTVIFHALINSNGQPSEFKLIRSSGHRSLDLKTLKAIRDWKFYPGQEGWVEIPFQWDLKGEPQAVGGTLRKVSQK